MLTRAPHFDLLRVEDLIQEIFGIVGSDDVTTNIHRGDAGDSADKAHQVRGEHDELTECPQRDADGVLHSDPESIPRSAAVSSTPNICLPDFLNHMLLHVFLRIDAVLLGKVQCQVGDFSHEGPPSSL